MNFLRWLWRWLTMHDVSSAAEVERARQEFLSELDSLDTVLARQQACLRARRGARRADGKLVGSA